MTLSETVRALAGRIHAAGGAAFSEDPPGSGVFAWRTRLGRWPFEMQVDRWAFEVRCYLADELLCTGRIPEEEADGLLAAVPGPGDAAARRELQALVEATMRGDPRRFLTPPHADRHPDRREDARQRSTIQAKPARDVDLPA